MRNRKSKNYKRKTWEDTGNEYSKILLINFLLSAVKILCKHDDCHVNIQLPNILLL